jgi:hypothetical protein
MPGVMGLDASQARHQAVTPDYVIPAARLEASSRHHHRIEPWVSPGESTDTDWILPFHAAETSITRLGRADRVFRIGHTRLVHYSK